MCTAKSRGGQRCFSSASKALANAHAKKVATEIAYTAATQSGASERERETLLRKGLAAEYAYEDALSQYASTVKGRADLTERLATSAPAYHQANLPNDPYRPDDVITLKTALLEGDHLRSRAAETKRAVKAGELSEEAAIKRSEYPNEFGRAARARHIEDTVARVKRGWNTSAAPATTPAAASPVRPEPDTAGLARLSASLRENLPYGGTVVGKFTEWQGQTVLDITQITVRNADGTDDDTDADELPEDIIGQDKFEELSNNLHDMLDAGTLPNYTPGDRDYKFDFGESAGSTTHTPARPHPADSLPSLALDGWTIQPDR